MDFMKGIVANRLAEPSTYLGLFAVLSAFGIHTFTAEQSSALVPFLLAVLGGVHIAVPNSLLIKPKTK